MFNCSRLSCNTSSLLLISIAISGYDTINLAYGQNGQFLRLDGSNSVFLDHVNSNPGNGETGNSFDFDPILAFASLTEIGTSEDASASATTSGEAMNLTPIGNTTFVPTVNTASITELQAFTTVGGSATAELDDGTAIQSEASFQLQGGLPQYRIDAQVYLVAAGGFLANGDASVDLANSFVSAYIGAFGAEASLNLLADPISWNVMATLPGGQSISFETPTVNHHFRFSFTASPGSVFDFLAQSAEGSTRVDAGPGGGNSNFSLATVAAVWAVATPIDEEPLPGDVDGDGDVDDDDYQIIVVGLGMEIGATQSGGDADFDGDVDCDDIDLWISNTTSIFLPADFDHNGVVDAVDIDLLAAEAASPTPNTAIFDLNRDGIVDFIPSLDGALVSDSDLLIRCFLHTEYADADLDQDVDGVGFLSFQIGHGANNGWSLGDFNGDLIVDGMDLELWELFYGFEFAPPLEALSVPEPSTAFLFAVAWFVLRRNRRFGSIMSL